MTRRHQLLQHAGESIQAQRQGLLARGDIEGLLRLNRSIFGEAKMLGSEDDSDDDSDDSDDDTDDSDDDSDDNDDSDDDSDDGKTSKGKKTGDSDVVKRLREENGRRRVENRRVKNELAQLKKELEDLKSGKGSGDDDKDDGEALRAAKSGLEKAEARIVELQLQNAFLGNTKYKWQNPKAALRLVDLSDVEIDDDGNIDGLEDALEALAKSDPYLLAPKDSGDSKGDKKPPAKTGSATGTGGKGSGNRESLLKKYPALRR